MTLKTRSIQRTQTPPCLWHLTLTLTLGLQRKYNPSRFRGGVITYWFLAQSNHCTAQHYWRRRVSPLCYIPHWGMKPRQLKIISTLWPHLQTALYIIHKISNDNNISITYLFLINHIIVQKIESNQNEFEDDIYCLVTPTYLLIHYNIMILINNNISMTY